MQNAGRDHFLRRSRDMAESAMSLVCPNCEATMAGDYCASCGQARFRPQDRRLRHLFGEAFEALTDLDGRLWRSLRAALLEPGRIARDWFDGRRARWVSPIRLFLLANLLYFFSPGLTDLSLPFHNQVRGAIYAEFAGEVCKTPATAWKCASVGQPHSALTGPLVRAVLARERSHVSRGGSAFSLADVEHRYNASSDAVGKLLVVLHVPFMALALLLFAWRSRRYYAEHFVAALGMLTFVMFFVQVVIKPGAWLYGWAMQAAGQANSGMPAFALAGSLLVYVWYFAATCRRCYGSGWPMAALQGLAVFAALAAANIWIYRPVQFLMSLWTM
jgi:hypothetical protein